MTQQAVHTELVRFEKIRQQLYESSAVKRLIADTLSEAIAEAATAIIDCMQSLSGKIILFGNGGSAADAQHLAGEFVGRFKLERVALPAIALTTDTSIITAIANDYGYHTIFARQVEAQVQEKDVVIGISASGNSVNVLEGLRKAKQMGAKTIGLLGGNGGKIAMTADIVLAVPSSDTPRIQEGHITIGHIICGLVEDSLVLGTNC